MLAFDLLPLFSVELQFFDPPAFLFAIIGEKTQFFTSSTIFLLVKRHN